MVARWLLLNPSGGRAGERVPVAAGRASEVASAGVPVGAFVGLVAGGQVVGHESVAVPA